MNDAIDALTPEERQAFEDHGQPFIQSLRNRLQRDLDIVLVVTGDEGVGKSTLALRLALLFSDDGETISTHDILSNTGDYIARARELDPGSPIVLDEAFDGANSRRAMKQSNVDFMRFLGEARALRLVHILCFPRLHNLDPYIRAHRMTYRLHVPTRGEAEVYEVQSDKFSNREPYQQLVTKFTFPHLEDHPVWPHYQSQKLDNIHDSISDMTTE